MIFGRSYKNNKIEENKYVEINHEEFYENSLKEEDSIDIHETTKVDETIEMAKESKEIIKNKIKDLDFNIDSFFDEDIKNALDGLYSYISRYMPNYPKYYEKDGKINPQAFLDAREILKNELPVSPDELLHSDDTYTGIINETKIHFDNGFSVDELGNVYNQDRKIIYAYDDPTQLVKSIDFINDKFVTENGIRLDLPEDFIKKIDPEDKKKIEEKIKEIKNRDKIKPNPRNQIDPEDKKNDTAVIIAMKDDKPIYENEKAIIDLPVDGLFIGDLVDNEEELKKINLVKNLKSYNKEYKNLGMCNLKDIPYAELNSLIFWGGGERGVKPLASNSISDKDIKFFPDGSVGYTGENSTISTHRAGCPSKSYQTGHVCMYTQTNKMGVKRGIIQYLYAFCNAIGLFHANIPPLLGFKHFKVFSGICIGGLIEIALCKWQEKISKRINSLFRCIPAEMVSDNAISCFENETYPYGASVKNLEELDLIQSCKVGDRYVVNFVPPKITGNKEMACGIFVFDPQNRYTELYSWKYKNWSGKPFVPDAPTDTTKTHSINVYNNPMVQDTLMNTNALGEDSITRRMIALQYAFAKKESLLVLQDIKYSIDNLIDQSVLEVLDKSLYQIYQYLDMKDKHIQVYPGVYGKIKEDYTLYDKYESPTYANIFLEYFKFLLESETLKQIPLDKCYREYEWVITIDNDDNSGTKTTYRKVERYYDFSGYDQNEYLVPNRNLVEFYDLKMFAARFIPKDEIKETIKSNINLLKSIKESSLSLEGLTTIKSFYIAHNKEEEVNNNIQYYLKYKDKELRYNGYPEEAISHMRKRISYTIENAVVFGKEN